MLVFAMLLDTFATSTDVRADLFTSIVEIASEPIRITWDSQYRTRSRMRIDYLDCRLCKDLKSIYMYANLLALLLRDSLMKVAEMCEKRVGRYSKATGATP